MIKISAITEVMQYINGLKAVVFDLDDTLYGEKEYVQSGYRAVSQILSQVKNAENKLWNAFEEKKSAFDEVLNTEELFTEELKQKCLEIYRNHKPDIHFYSGVQEILEELKKQKILIGVITDGRPEGQRAKIKALELEKYVDYIIVTDELGGTKYRKPCEKAFLLMKEKMEEISKQEMRFPEICYVGDNVKKDFIAPEKLGMRSIWFRNRDGLYI